MRNCRTIIYLLILLFTLLGCSNKVVFIVKDKQYSCNQLPVKIINVSDKKEDIANKLIDTTANKKRITINFDSGFDNNVKTFINDSLIFDENLKSNPSSGFTGKSFFFEYSNKISERFILRVIIDNRDCIITELDLRYYKLHIRNDLGVWIIAYNNNFIFYH